MNRLTRDSVSRSRLFVRSTLHNPTLLLRLYSSDTPSPPSPPQPQTDVPAQAQTSGGTPPAPRRRVKRRIRAPSQIAHNLPFPDISTPNPFLDLSDSRQFPPSKLSPFASRVVRRPKTEVGVPRRRGEEEEEAEVKSAEDDEHAPILPLSRRELEKLHRFPLIRRRVTQQTGKGKIHRQGHDDPSRATGRAFAMAVRNMDFVDRFEGRTIWTEMSSKLGATRIILRPRPVGFGLHCNPNVHQVLKAAGIKDISAKVWGSRNPLNVIKLLFRMLHAGNAPLAMGNGIGGPGRKLDKGSGVRGKQEIERERGRKLINLRTQ
ncbi:hypothetical protein EDB83DRAFT_2656763 [Lactarius deliciosus]|nr:hypothetical protein EDB83DRAFT_2656763 [Lactarius deliciosus]